MNQNTILEEEVINKIKKLVETNPHITIFSDNEVKVLRDIISVYETLASFGRVGGWIKNVLLGISVTIGAYMIIQNSGATMIKQIISYFTG